jgi:hypothetical protein
MACATRHEAKKKSLAKFFFVTNGHGEPHPRQLPVGGTHLLICSSFNPSAISYKHGVDSGSCLLRFCKLILLKRLAIRVEALQVYNISFWSASIWLWRLLNA